MASAWLGSAVRGKTSFRPLVERGGSASHQLPGNAGSMFGPLQLSARPEGTPRLSLFGQHDSGVLYKLSGRSLLEAPLHSGRAPLGMGSAQLAFTESNASAGQVEPGTRHAISEQSPLGQVDAPPKNGSQNLGDLRQGRGRPLRLKRVVWFFKESRRLNPPRPITVPIWDLPTVLRALKSPPFEPLKSVDLHPLTLKNALLLALASVKHMGDLQVLSVSPTCLEFDPGNSKVILKPRLT